MTALLAPLRRPRPAGPLLVVAALAIAIPCATPAQEAEDLTPAFGNTIVSTHPDGRQAKLWLSQDFTYAAEGRAGERSEGRWKVKSGKLCLTQHRPVPIPFSYCKAFTRQAVGSRWTDKAVNGDRVTNQIVAGR